MIKNNYLILKIMGSDVSIKEKDLDQTFWFVAIVTNKTEFYVAEKLEKQGVTAYVPHTLSKSIKGKAKYIRCPLMPARVFVKCSEQNRKLIVQYPFISRFMVDITSTTKPKKLAIVKDHEIETLKYVTGHADRPVHWESVCYRCGDKVRAARGAMMGCEGYISEDPQGVTKLHVDFGMLGGAAVEIDAADLERI